MSKLTSQELDIYKNYILNEIAERFKKHGHVEPKHLKSILDIDVEISEITELIYPKIEFNTKSYISYKSLDKFNLIDKPNNLFDNYELITVSVPVRCLQTPDITYQVTPYSPKDTRHLVNKNRLKSNYPFFSMRNQDETILTNDDKETVDFFDKEYQLVIDYMKQHITELQQYRTKIEELLLDIFKKLKPISSQKLIGLINKYYNSED